MDCVIRIIKGPEEGEQFTCTGTEAVVGRSPRSAVRLSSPSASYEHAVISRTGDDFYIENLSATGTFVNEERITGRVRLRARDQLRFGSETVARVDSVPTGGKGGGSRRVLITAVISMLAVAMILVVFDPLSTPVQNLDMVGAYGKLEPWTQDEVQRRILPAETAPLLNEAWRLQTTGDKEGSQKLWRQLNVLLASAEPRTGFLLAADQEPHALARVASKDPKFAEHNDDEMGAALVQFVSRMARR